MLTIRPNTINGYDVIRRSRISACQIWMTFIGRLWCRADNEWLLWVSDNIDLSSMEMRLIIETIRLIRRSDNPRIYSYET